MFEKDAPLRDEFKYLYASVFKKPENYVKIIEALGTKKVGMTREEIITSTKIPNSGDLTTKLEELEKLWIYSQVQCIWDEKEKCDIPVDGLLYIVLFQIFEIRTDR